MNNSDKKENDKKILNEKISKIIEQSKDNDAIRFISSKLSSLQSLKVKTKIVDILESILLNEINYNLLTKQIFEGIPDDILSLRPFYLNIKKDILRTKSNMNFVSTISKNFETNAQIMNRILFIYAKIHQEVSYVQGMNDLLAPIYYCFSKDNNPDNKNFVEADSYISFEKLMEIIKNIYIRKLDNETGGIYFRLNEISGLLKIADYELYLHLKRNKIEMEFYGFRWMTLFFTQDFEMPDILRLWDSIFGNRDIFEFLYLLILAAIIIKKKEIMKEKMSGIMMIIQNMEDITPNDLINKAVQIRNDLSKKYIW